MNDVVNLGLGFEHRAKEAGITIVNEVGVDPGIDHMLAMQCFDEVKVHGGKVSCLLSINFLLCILSPCTCYSVFSLCYSNRLY